jgi:O-antigen/teichoic acid export membrane protein
MAAGYIPIILIDIPYSRKMESIVPIFSRAKIINLFKVCFPVFAVAFLSLIVVNVPKYVIDRSLTNDSQAIYNIIVMPGTSIALFSQVIIQSFLLKLAQFRQNAQMNRFSSLIGKIVIMIVLFSGLFALFCYFWGNALLHLLYGIDLNQYIPLLLIVVAGSMFSSITGVLSAALVALRVTKIQLYLYLASLLSALVISPLIIPTFGLFGAAMAYFAIMFIQFLLYVFTYIGNYYHEKRAGQRAANNVGSNAPTAANSIGQKEAPKESV